MKAAKPKRKHLDRTISDLEYVTEKLAPRLLANFRWAKNARYFSLVRRDDVKVSTSGQTDTTGNLATGRSQERIGEALDAATTSVVKALGLLESADRTLDKAFRKADPAYERVDNTFKKKLITEDELNKAKAAKARREAAGGGFGES